MSSEGGARWLNLRSCKDVYRSAMVRAVDDRKASRKVINSSSRIADRLLRSAGRPVTGL